MNSPVFILLKINYHSFATALKICNCLFLKFFFDRILYFLRYSLLELNTINEYVFNRPISQIPNCTWPAPHKTLFGDRNIQMFQYGVLWYMGNVHCVICETPWLNLVSFKQSLSGENFSVINHHSICSIHRFLFYSLVALENFYNNR